MKHKILNITKGKFQKVYELLDKQGYITDQQACEIWGDEDGVYKVEEHKRIWRKLNADRDFFKDKKIVEKKKGYRCHLVRLENMDSWYKVGKEFFSEIVI